MLEVISTRTLKNTARLVTYTLNGQRAASFAPAKGDVTLWLTESLGLRVDLTDRLKAIERASELNISISLWEKGGHKRAYINLYDKKNGGKHWNRGMGGAWYVDMKSGKSRQSVDWAGAATRNFFDEQIDELIEQVAALAA